MIIGTEGIAKAQAVFRASDARIGALLTALDDFDRSATRTRPLYQHLEDISQKAAPDRSRMTTAEQTSALGHADSVIRELHESNARLDRLSAMLTQSASAPDGKAVAEASSAITPLDEKLANADQLQNLKRAREVAAPWAWLRLEERLKTLGPTPSAADETEVVGLYRLVSHLNATGSTEQERQLLERGKAMEEDLAASDRRLKQLVLAANVWRQSGTSRDDAHLAALRAIKRPFDTLRFNPEHQAAWDLLSQGDAILHAPERGLNAATKEQIPICVMASDFDQASNRVADSVRNRLRVLGFQITLDCKNAAIISEIVGISVDPAYRDRDRTDLAIPPLTTTAHLQSNTRWAGNNKPVFQNSEVNAKFTGAMDAVKFDVENEARAEAANQLVGKFEALTAK